MMSDSTKTVHTVVRRTGFFAFREIPPISSRPSPKASAELARNLPVPAAHLSFITKSFFPVLPDLDAFGVLAAHVDHGAGAGKKVRGSLGMAADFGDLRVAKHNLVAA